MNTMSVLLSHIIVMCDNQEVHIGDNAKHYCKYQLRHACSLKGHTDSVRNWQN